MKELFREVMDIDGVRGALLYSFEGDLLYKEFTGQAPSDIDNRSFWITAINSLKTIKECEIVFESARLYIKETTLGYLLLWMETDARIALVRLSCDMLITSLAEQKAVKGKWGFFRKKK